MADVEKCLPLFVKKHEDCLESLRVISEYDNRFYDYDQFMV